MGLRDHAYPAGAFDGIQDQSRPRRTWREFLKTLFPIGDHSTRSHAPFGEDPHEHRELPPALEEGTLTHDQQVRLFNEVCDLHAALVMVLPFARDGYNWRKGQGSDYLKMPDVFDRMQYRWGRGSDDGEVWEILQPLPTLIEDDEGRKHAWVHDEWGLRHLTHECPGCAE